MMLKYLARLILIVTFIAAICFMVYLVTQMHDKSPVYISIATIIGSLIFLWAVEKAS